MKPSETPLGEHPFDRELTRHLDQTGRRSFHLDDDAEQKRQVRRTLMILAVMTGTVALAALILFIALDPQKRIHAALSEQLFGDKA